ncbi:transcription factor 7-like 1, partial [Melanotaenia boesemani]|uniref:transcription factor 7-like 1 n=1 Tax=Melanotaenia boesemani TaxID=1250792 RepID=UPI001C03A447
MKVCMCVCELVGGRHHSNLFHICSVCLCLQVNSLPVLWLVDGQLVVPPGYLMPVHDPRHAATTQSACCSQKRKRDDHSEPPYVKKPPNAFMLFLKEQRVSVVAELGHTGS